MATTVIIAGLVLFGAIIYLIITTLSYVGQASTLDLQLTDLKTALEGKKQRLEDYQIKADILKEEVPGLKNRCDRLNRWIGLLKQQKSHLQANPKKEEKGAAERDAAIQKSISAAQRRKG